MSEVPLYLEGVAEVEEDYHRLPQHDDLLMRRSFISSPHWTLEVYGPTSQVPHRFSLVMRFGL